MGAFEYTNYVQVSLPWNKLVSIASGGKCYRGESEVQSPSKGPDVSSSRHPVGTDDRERSDR